VVLWARQDRCAVGSFQAIFFIFVLEDMKRQKFIMEIPARFPNWAFYPKDLVAAMDATLCLEEEKDG
jgi:hypothetical protein